MYTGFLIAIVIMFGGYIISEQTWEPKIFYTSICVACVIAIAMLLNYVIVTETNKPVEITTPSKYTSQTYYIDTNNQLYIKNNGTTKPFGGNISKKIEYKDSATRPSIEFKTIKQFKNMDNWIPFKYNTSINTSISKVVLPPSALTKKLTEVKVLNTSSNETLNDKDPLFSNK